MIKESTTQQLSWDSKDCRLQILSGIGKKGLIVRVFLKYLPEDEG
jgi:hypothetical protein